MARNDVTWSAVKVDTSFGVGPVSEKVPYRDSLGAFTLTPMAMVRAETADIDTLVYIGSTKIVTVPLK